MRKWILLCLLSASIVAFSQDFSPPSKHLNRSHSSIRQGDEVCNRLPPSLWCISAELTKKCGYSEMCDKYTKQNHNKPILITLLYESLCPGCQKFITEQLYPHVLKNFGPDFVQIEMVPYGNAKMDESGTITCQHGEDECTINTFESCLIEALPDFNKHVPVIYCLEMLLKNKIDFDKATAKCFKTLGVDTEVQTMIQSCLVTADSRRLQQLAAKRTGEVYPEKHDHVPWILFNNASIGNAQMLLEDIPSLICSWWTGDKKIPFCEVEKSNKLKYWVERGCENS